MICDTYSDAKYPKRTYSIARLALLLGLLQDAIWFYITVHAQKVYAACVTVITTPRRYNRELGRSKRLQSWFSTNIADAELQLECLSWATFVIFRFCFSQWHNILYVTNQCCQHSWLRYLVNMKKAMEYTRSAIISDEIQILYTLFIETLCLKLRCRDVPHLLLSLL